MNFRYFRIRTFAAAALVAGALLGVACSEEIEAGKPIDETPYETIYETNGYLLDQASNQSVVTIAPTGQEYTATLSFGLAFEAGEKNIMRRPPRDPKLHVMDGFAIWRVIFVGSMIAVSAFVLEAWLQPRGYSPEFIRTVLLQTLVTAQWFYMLNCRVADGFSLSKGLLANRGIWIVSGVLLVLQLLIIYAPFMQMLFGTEALPFRYWVITFIIGFVMFLIVEVEKPLTRRWRTA